MNFIQVLATLELKIK